MTRSFSHQTTIASMEKSVYDAPRIKSETEFLMESSLLTGSAISTDPYVEMPGQINDSILEEDAASGSKGGLLGRLKKWCTP